MVRSEPSLQPGSMADIAGRLVLWARRNPQGLVRVEYSSEFARQDVLQQVQAQLSGEAIPISEVALPSNQAADAVVADLLQQLEQVATKAPHSVVSITGFATAFHHQAAWPDALRVVNFNRERFAALPLRQLWWFTPAIMQTAIHAMPDLNSWFSQRLQLTESVAFTDTPPISLATDTPAANIDDARQRSQTLVAQFHQAQQAGAPDAELLKTYLLPALEALAEASAQRDLRELAGEFEGWLGRLKLRGSTDLAYSLDRLARIYKKQGRYREALPLYRQALKIREQQLGSDHPDVASSLYMLAGMYHSHGRYVEADPLYLLALKIFEQQLGTDHPDVATSLNNLAALYQAQGRYGEAEPLYQRSLQIREQQLGTDHPDVATSLNNLASLYDDQGRYGEAEPLYIRALEIGVKTLPAEHPKIALRQDNFSSMIRSAVAAGQADQLSGHPTTQAILQQLREE